MFGRSVCGVDIGSSAIKVARLTRSRGRLILADALRVPLAFEYPPGTDSWLISAAQALASALRARRMRLGSVVLGVGGRDTILRYSQIPPVPDARLALIMRYQIDEISNKTEEPVCADYRVLPVKQDFSDDRTVLIALAKERFVSRQLQMLSGVSSRIASVNAAPVALYNAYLAAGRYAMPPAGEENVTTLVASIGAENTDIAIIRDRGLLFARSVSKGAREFTEALAEGMGLSFDEAEQVKTAEGMIKTESYRSDSERAVCDAILPVAGEFAALINSSVQFAKSQIKLERLKIDRVLLCGGGARLKGFAEFLEEKVGVPVTVFDPAAALSPSSAVTSSLDWRPPASEFVTAIGLAAAALRPGAVDVNLLPEKYRKRRDFAERTRFLAAAGVATFLFLVVFFASALMEGLKAGKADGIKTSVVNEVGERKSALDANLKKNAAAKSTVNYASLFTRRGFYYSLLLKCLCEQGVMPQEVVVDEVTMSSLDGGKGALAGPMDFGIGIIGRVVGDVPNRMDVVTDFRNRLRTAIDEAMKKTAPLEFRPRINIDAGHTLVVRNAFKIVLDLKTEEKQSGPVGKE